MSFTCRTIGNISIAYNKAEKMEEKQTVKEALHQSRKMMYEQYDVYLRLQAAACIKNKL